MKNIALIYIAGALITKFAVDGSGLDNGTVILEWPFYWWQNPRGMLALFRTQLATQEAGAGSDLAFGRQYYLPPESSTVRGCSCAL